MHYAEQVSLKAELHPILKPHTHICAKPTGKCRVWFDSRFEWILSHRCRRIPSFRTNSHRHKDYD